MSAPERPGRSVVASDFANDDGAPSPQVVNALNALARGEGSPRDVMTAIATSRLVIPVVAMLDSTDVTADGLTVEKESSMATVLIQGVHGERAMLAFTSLDSMRQWRSDARPAPVWGSDAAKAALAENADSLLVDVNGPRPFAIPSDELRALARAIDEESLRNLLQTNLAGLSGVVGVELDTQEGDRSIVLSVDPGLAEAEYRRLLDEVATTINDEGHLQSAVAAGVGVRVVAAPDPSRGDRTDEDTPGAFHAS